MSFLPYFFIIIKKSTDTQSKMEKQELVKIYKQARERIMVTTQNLRKTNFTSVVTFFRTIDKRFFDFYKKQWFFPESAQNLIVEKMKTLNIKVEIKEFQPAIIIVESDNEFTIQYEFSPATYELIKCLNNAVYQYDTREWHLPNDQLQPFIDLLEKNDLQYTLEDVKTEPVSIIPRPKKPRQNAD